MKGVGEEDFILLPTHHALRTLQNTPLVHLLLQLRRPLPQHIRLKPPKRILNPLLRLRIPRDRPPRTPRPRNRPQFPTNKQSPDTKQQTRRHIRQRRLLQQLPDVRQGLCVTHISIGFPLIPPLQTGNLLTNPPILKPHLDRARSGLVQRHDQLRAGGARAHEQRGAQRDAGE